MVDYRHCWNTQKRSQERQTTSAFVLKRELFAVGWTWLTEALGRVENIQVVLWCR